MTFLTSFIFGVACGIAALACLQAIISLFDWIFDLKN